MGSGKTLHAPAGRLRRGRVSPLRIADASVAVLAAALLATLLANVLTPALAFADLPVHVASPTDPAPDTCAICHRAHTATERLGYMTTESTAPVGNALIQAQEPGRGDVGLCFTCHGIASLGASVDIETPLTLDSVHRVAPSESPTFGPNPKMCGSCHDPHGTDRTGTGEPYAALLRAWTSAGATVTAGVEYCDACHAGRAPAGSRYLGTGTYRQTGHFTRMPDPASGTGVRCMACHEEHGSNVAPLITGRVTRPPALGTAVETTVTANNRTFCVACHESDLGTWANAIAYAGSSHAQSDTQTVIPGEWPAPGAERKLGECQVCHAPMGAVDGTGDLIPDLVERAGREMCDQCHQPAGPASADLLTIAYDQTESDELELVAAYGPTTQTANAHVAVYGRDPDDTDILLGPRRYRAYDAGPVAVAGDVDGDGEDEVVIASPSQDKLSIYDRDPLLGIVTELWDVDVPISPDLLALGRFHGTPDREQIAVVDASTGEVAIYGYDGSGLSLAWSDTLPGGTDAVPTGIASGDVTGTVGLDDLVITDTYLDELHHYYYDGSAMSRESTYTLLSPCGPSIGDATSAEGNAIVICNRDEMTATLSVFDSSGVRLDYEADNDGGTAVPVASVVADVWSGSGTDEVCVALYSETGTNYVNVFSQSGAGLDPTPYRHSTGDAYGTASIAAGDLDGDGEDELIVGNGGLWDTGVGMVAPSVQVFNAVLGSGPMVRSLYAAGGAELAGPAPALAVADLGPVLPSRHPIDEVDVSHNSTETAPFDRHVTCADCHNPHEANAAVASAPLIGGPMKGTWGIPAGDLGGTTVRAQYQYETCFKCHSDHVALEQGRRDIAAEVATSNASVHAVELGAAPSAANTSTFVSGWTNDSILYCSDCHGNSTPSEPRGGHRSKAAPILKSPILGIGAGDASGLCYDCHNYDLYRSGSGDDGTNGSFFYGTKALHRKHSGEFTGADPGLELSCLACHVSHGSATEPHLLRSDIDSDVADESCTNDCHGGAARSY